MTTSDGTAATAEYRCSQEPHPGVEFYGDGACAECGFVPEKSGDRPMGRAHLLAEWRRVRDDPWAEDSYKTEIGDLLAAAADVRPAAQSLDVDDISSAIWSWFNRHDAPWSPSDRTVSEVCDAIVALVTSEPVAAEPAGTADPDAVKSAMWRHMDRDGFDMDSAARDILALLRNSPAAPGLDVLAAVIQRAGFENDRATSARIIACKPNTAGWNHDEWNREHPMPGPLHVAQARAVLATLQGRTA